MSGVSIVESVDALLESGTLFRKQASSLFGKVSMKKVSAAHYGVEGSPIVHSFRKSGGKWYMVARDWNGTWSLESYASPESALKALPQVINMKPSGELVLR